MSIISWLLAASLTSRSLALSLTAFSIFVSAKIDRNNIDHIIALKPDGIVVGKAILESDDPVGEAQFYYDKCKR